MLNVISGKLGREPELKVVETSHGKLSVSNNVVYVWDGKENSSNIPVQVTAWGKQAKELAQYSKGDTIQFIGSVQPASYKPEGIEKPITTMGYAIQKIDHEKRLIKEHDALLWNYVKGETKDLSVDNKEEAVLDEPSVEKEASQTKKSKNVSDKEKPAGKLKDPAAGKNKDMKTDDLKPEKPEGMNLSDPFTR